MVGFVSLLSFELMIQTEPSKNVTGQHKERTFQCKSKEGEGGGGLGGHNFLVTKRGVRANSPLLGTPPPYNYCTVPNLQRCSDHVGSKGLSICSKNNYSVYPTINNYLISPAEK